MVDENKFCFIICTNEEQQLQECIMYLGLLHVPEGYQTESIAINDAPSMAAGYNEGMAATDAKYKVYLHQDVFIVDPLFLDKLLGVFQKDERIGMVGVIGTEHLPEDGVMWHGKRCGNFYRLEEMLEMGLEGVELLSSGHREVEAVDGFLIATQYDIPWREDIFQGWDFYDVSQCMEFRRAGYRIIVPEQRENGVIHCCDPPSLRHYDEYREILLKEYPEISGAGA